MSNDQSETKHIQEDIEKYGFPLEVRTAEILETKGWELTNQATFQDTETKKFRTVDIIAQKSLVSKPNDLSIELLLVIECKSFFKTPKPWVFYASPYNLNDNTVRRKTCGSSQFILSSTYFQKKHSIDEEFAAAHAWDEVINEFLLGIHFKSPIFSKLGYIPFEAFTEGKTKTIHKATMQVCNAILHYIKQIEEEKIDLPFGMLFLPIIVTNEPLYTYHGKRLNHEDGLFYYLTYANSAFMFEILNENFLTQYLDFLAGQMAEFQKS